MYFCRVRLQLAQRLFNGFEQNISMIIAKDEHRSQPDRRLATRANLHTVLAHHRAESVPRRRVVEVPGDECPETLAPQILDHISTAFEHALQRRVQLVADLGGVGDEVVTLNDVDQLVGLEGTNGVSL